MLSLSKLSLFFLAIILSACGGGTSSDRYAGYIGQSAADIQVLTLDGEPMHLAKVPELYGDKPIILNVWATWCAPCVKELPSLDALAKDEKYTVLALSTDKKPETIMAFLQKQPWGTHLKIFNDPAGKATFSSIGARAIPVTYILDETLIIRAVEAGERDWNSAKMRKLIQTSLDKN